MKIRIGNAFSLTLVSLMLTLGACGQSSTAAPNEVGMVAADFSRTSITIKAGAAVHFTDAAGTGATHDVCLGSDGACDNAAKGPQALKSPGFTINAGDPAKDVTFDTPGTYKVTCSLHPAMNLTVIVQ